MANLCGASGANILCSPRSTVSAGRRGRPGSRSVDAGGEERLHQPAELRLLLCLGLHPDSCRVHRDSDRDHRVLCHSERDQESVNCGKNGSETPETDFWFHLNRFI